MSSLTPRLAGSNPASSDTTVTDLGQVVACLPFDVEGERQTAAIRRAAAIVAAIAGLWLMMVADHWVHWVFGIAAGAASLGWTHATRRARDQAEARSRWRLLVREHGVERIHGNDAVRVDWGDVFDIDVDEERMVLTLWRRELPPLVIEPVYRSGGLDGLYTVLKHAAQESRRRADQGRLA